MSSSGTYAFNAGASDLVIDAFGRLQIEPSKIDTEKIVTAARQANLLLVSQWSNKQPNLWRSETQTIAVVQGTATYSPTARTVSVLLAMIRTGSGETQNDRVLGPISTTEYQSMPNKNQQSPPTAFWFNRQIAPAITLYPTPDTSYSLVIQTVSQAQDVLLANGTTLDVPVRFLDAFAAGLAHRLARFYKPELEGVRKQDAAEAYALAFDNDTEQVPVYVTPALGAYYS